MNTHFLDIPGNKLAAISDLTYFEFFRSANNFQLQTVSEINVLNFLRGLKSNALGSDNISLDMLLMTLPRTLGIITSIINRSISTSTFPNLWKMAVVQPIPKVVNPNSIKDVRPISLLPCISKILERAVFNQLRNYLEQSKLLPVTQSGFRQKHSTTTALLDVVDNILEGRVQSMTTLLLLVLLDYSRAFDAINVSLLLSKLSYYGCSSETIKWFHSYLSCRS